MKYSINILLSLLLFNIAFINICYSQESIRIGVKGGLNIANIKGYSTSPDNSAQPGFHAGFYGNILLKNKIGIAIEALYSQKGTITKTNPESFVRVNYFEIPVLFTYELYEGLTAQIGLTTGIPIVAYVRGVKDFLNTTSKPTFSIPIGMVYEFDNGINLGWRADFGASNISTPSGDGGKNYVFMLSVGYSFYKKE